MTCYMNQFREEDSPDVTVVSWCTLCRIGEASFSGHHVALEILTSLHTRNAGEEDTGRLATLAHFRTATAIWLTRRGLGQHRRGARAQRPRIDLFDISSCQQKPFPALTRLGIRRKGDDDGTTPAPPVVLDSFMDGSAPRLLSGRENRMTGWRKMALQYW